MATQQEIEWAKRWNATTRLAERLKDHAAVSLAAARDAVERFGADEVRTLDAAPAITWAPEVVAYARERDLERKRLDALLDGRTLDAPTADPPMRWAELEADRDTLFRVCKSLGGDVVENAVNLEGWAARAQQTHGIDRQQVTVGQVFSLAGINLDLRALQRAEEAKVRTLSQSVETPRPEGEVDALGRVHFPASTDLDAILADEVAPLRAYREVRKLAQSCDGAAELFTEDRDQFASNFRILTDSGVDVVGTARLAAHNDELQRAAEAADRREELAREQQHRDAVAAARNLAHGVEETVRALEAPSAGVPNPHPWR